MSTLLLVTGMMRSGTSLVQALLDGLPEAVVAYQPFHQFLVDVKQLFLDEHGIATALPLDEGDPAHAARRDAFTAWLGSRRFARGEAGALFERATAGKGGGFPGLALPAPPDGAGFFDLLLLLLSALPADASRARYLGHKEILCEEFVPAFVAAGMRCTLVLRDPRAVVTSAAHGRYRDMVGDRYPVTMMIRIWRKSAAYWLRYRGHPQVLCLRYEDVASEPRGSMRLACEWFGIAPATSADAGATPLRDARGRPWRGNSSFGDLPGVDASSIARWRDLMGEAEARYVAACCRHEMLAAGYETPGDLRVRDIEDFEEAADGVRPAYLARHRLDEAVRRAEIERFLLPGAADAAYRTHFLFPEAVAAHRAADAVAP